MDKDKKLQYCQGCKDNFYNGNNPYGIKECWCLQGARVVWRKEVHVDQRPPWKQGAIRVLECYKRPRYVYINADREY